MAGENQSAIPQCQMTRQFRNVSSRDAAKECFA